MKRIYLNDYHAPEVVVESLALSFELSPEQTIVTATSRVKKTDPTQKTLTLNGEMLILKEIMLNEKPLAAESYRVLEHHLEIDTDLTEFELKIITEISPSKNLSLSGLYMSQSLFCTQCEAEGFRRITYFWDRPDVLTTYTVTVIAPTTYPCLLSNGNLVKKGMLNDTQHYAVWHDPFPKPCYLFALVAGELHCTESTFTTQSGSDILLQFYTETAEAIEIQHALESLKHAMRWDEEYFGREYDLERYMIVAIQDFNMGAMENKGLNVFNAKYVLGSKDTATDDDLDAIESVIAHEYFHNWSGNRVTCRDWFQLSLKEGFTVFREQWFSETMRQAALKRIAHVNFLKTKQFAEDAGAMAHAVQPQSYVKIDNFYTVTIYEKGAEVIRMLKTILGDELFRKGSDDYFETNDGRAATIDDFVRSMERVSSQDLTQFKRWYHTKGTPVVTIETEFLEAEHQFKISFKQTSQSEKGPLMIPLKLLLLSETGEALSDEMVYVLREESDTLVISNIKTRPLVSLNREFTAPVQMVWKNTEHAEIIAKVDDDPVNRNTAYQELCFKQLDKSLLKEMVHDEAVNTLSKVWKHWFANEKRPGFLATLLQFPAESLLATRIPHYKPVLGAALRETLLQRLIMEMTPECEAALARLKAAKSYAFTERDVEERSLKHVLLRHLVRIHHEEATHLSYELFQKADNLTDRLEALKTLMFTTHRDEVLATFYKMAENNPNLLSKWFAVQASHPAEWTFHHLPTLLKHPKYQRTRPNLVYAIWTSFCQSNLGQFHAGEGKGYTMLLDEMQQIDAFNPQLAARLMEPFKHVQQLHPVFRERMLSALKRLDFNTLSDNVREIALAVRGVE